MKHRYAHLLLAAFGLLSAQYALAQPPCNTAFTTPAGQTAVQTSFSATTTAGSTTVVLSGTTIGLSVGQSISGPLIPVGATIASIVNATTITISIPATITGGPTPGHVAGNWGPASVPANITANVNTTTTAGSTTATVGSAAGLVIGNGVTGPNIPAGTTIVGIAGTTITLSNPATGTGTNIPHTYILDPWTSNFPPTGSGSPALSTCSICPATFSVPICAGQYVNMYLCAGNLYTFSMCSSAAVWNSTITVTNTSGVLQNYPPNWDDDGCGTTNGHAVVTFTPQTSNLFRIRVFNDPCLVNNGLCGTLQIACNPFPPPPPNDNPAGAIALPGGTTCNPIFTSAAYGTPTSGVSILPFATPSNCGTGCTAGSGSYATSDVWYTAVVPASGNLAVELEHISATNMAMAVYTAPGPGGPFTQVPCGGANPGGGCNADLAPGILNPYLNLSGLVGGTTVYIRVWPEGGFANNGTFTLCAYEPVPPPNDQPCGATPIPVAPAACSPQTFNTVNATPSVGVPAPSCATPVAGDVWFTVTVPSTGSLTVNTGTGTLSNMAMQAYTAASCAGLFTAVVGACGDNQATVSVALTTTAGSTTATLGSTAGLNVGDGVSGPNVPANTTIAAVVNATTLTLSQAAITTGTVAHTIGNLMPRIVLTGNNGDVYYIRVWNQNLIQGTFQICAFQNNPPPNDNPCSPVGAAVLPVQAGCLFGPFQTNDLAGTTPSSLTGQHTSIQAPSCGGVPTNDVWYTAVVPTNGVLQFDTDDGQLTNAAMAIYTATGNCAAGTLALTQVPGGCFVNGSSNGTNMPAGQVTGLAPGSVVYIRVWREGGSDGTFQICARSTVPPPGACTYTLRMFDSAGDGWNGGFVTLCVGGSCTNYTINGSNSTITIGANLGQIITLSYTAVGGFQNQISYQLLSNTGGLIYGSTNPPTPGVNTAFVVDALCNVPPAPPSDCVGAMPVCDTQIINQNPNNSGGVADLNFGNDGCLSNEHQGVWFRFQAQLAGQLAFTIQPPSPTDYDWAMWGPFSGAVTCPPATNPIRCSWSAVNGATGLNYTSIDLSEGAGGDGWIRYLDVTPGQWYLLYVDNWSMNGVNFTLQWNNSPNNILDCSIVLPVEMLSLNAQPAADHVAVTWTTASEQGASHFVVERSATGDRFEPIGQVTAAGNTTNTTDYRFIDKHPLNGTNFYRLRTVDIDGTYGHTNVVTAEFRRGNVPLQLFPNPAFETIHASFVLDEEQVVRWRILDMSGRLVQESNVAGIAGPNLVEIPLGRVDGGSYLFELVGGSGSVLGNMRFVKH